MKKFDVEITETLQRKVSVEAASQEDAERMVTQAWNNQDYVLDSGDFTGVDFKTVGEHELAETRTKINADRDNRERWEREGRIAPTKKNDMEL